MMGYRDSLKNEVREGWVFCSKEFSCVLQGYYCIASRKFEVEASIYIERGTV